MNLCRLVNNSRDITCIHDECIDFNTILVLYNEKKLLHGTHIDDEYIELFTQLVDAEYNINKTLSILHKHVKILDSMCKICKKSLSIYSCKKCNKSVLSNLKKHIKSQYIEAMLYYYIDL